MTRTIGMTALGLAFGASAASAQLVNDASPRLEPVDQADHLIWSDEFDGFGLDLTKWEPMIGDGCSYGICGWGNNELQYYTDSVSNVLVDGGNLTITAREQNFGGKQYTSGRIRSLGMGDFRFGRIEARIKLPSTTGIWPAFWMLPTNSIYGGWASGGEIDIMESINQADRVYGTLHYGGQWPNNRSRGGSRADGTDYGADFHTYELEWRPDVIRWILDGVVWGQIPSSQWYSDAAPGNPSAPFDQTFHMLLNVAVGGNWPGNPNGSSVFPQSMVIDYVRVYSFGQGPYGGTAWAVPGRIQAEDFDFGVLGEAYGDSDATNNGGAYRPTSAVDLEATDGGGFNLGWFGAGEWLEYTAQFPKKGLYEVRARVATNGIGGTLEVRPENSVLPAQLSFTGTGGWQNWIETTGNLYASRAGEQLITIGNVGLAGLDFNLDWFELTPVAAGFAQPLTEADGADATAFIRAYLAGDPSADLAEPVGVFDGSDIDVFVREWLSWNSVGETAE